MAVNGEIKISDLIFQSPARHGSRTDSLCRVRTFVSPGQEVVALLTDLGDRNPGSSVTNSVEFIRRALIARGVIDTTAKIVEHYESNDFRRATFDVVSFSEKDLPNWHSISIQAASDLIGCAVAELEGSTL